MSWQDRDYAKGTTRGGGHVGGGGYRPGGIGAVLGGSVTKALIVINVAVFVVCFFLGGLRSENPVYYWGVLSGNSIWEFGQVWRIVTCTFLHADFFHIFMNMLGLYFLGPALERQWGPRMFLAVYLLSGIAANCFYLLLAGPFNYLPGGVPLLGASGCVLALLGAAAVLFPTAVVYVYGVFPIKIRTAAIVFGGLYAVNLWQKGSNAGGDACHLVGLLCGAAWAWRGHGWWVRSGQHRFSRVTSMFQGRGHRPVESPPTSRPPFQKSPADVDEQTLDRILKKVHDYGIHTLDEREREQLKAASDRLRSDYKS